MKELSIPTKKTNPIHKEAPEKTIFLLLDQPSGEASTTGTPITNKKEMAISMNRANWKAMVMIVTLHISRMEYLYHLIPIQ